MKPPPATTHQISSTHDIIIALIDTGKYVTNKYTPTFYEKQTLFKLIVFCIGHVLMSDINIIPTIMIKFNYAGKMIGRGCIPYCLMKNGYRKIPVFDNDCYICDGAFALGYFSLSKKDK
jgi:hypothetical protein